MFVYIINSQRTITVFIPTINLLLIITGFTGFSEPVRVRGRQDAAPPEPERAVHAEHRVARALLIELSVQELVLQRAQLRGVVLRAHRRARVLVPVRRAQRHRQIHGRQDAQNPGEDQGCGVPVIHHRSRARRVSQRHQRVCLRVFACPIFRSTASRHDLRINPEEEESQSRVFVLMSVWQSE